MTAENSKFVTRNLSPLIGTEIRSDIDTLLSGRYAGKLRQLLEERTVLVFPQIGFTEEQHIAFTRTLGKLGIENYGKAPTTTSENDPIFKVSLDSKVSPAAEGLKTSFFWHLDGSFSDTPLLASLLMPVKLSETGGQTEFANTYAAFEALPEEDTRAIDGLRVVHSNWARDRYLHPEPSYAQLKRALMGPSHEQPLVWTHRSGRKSLVVGLTASHVVGMDPQESWELLVRLRDWATQPQFVYHHEWKMGDLVIWDNTGSLHRALPYPWDSGRLMRRTMLEGEEAFA